MIPEPPQNTIVAWDELLAKMDGLRGPVVLAPAWNLGSTEVTR